jgi:hypothetical protein
MSSPDCILSPIYNTLQLTGDPRRLQYTRAHRRPSVVYYNPPESAEPATLGVCQPYNHGLPWVYLTARCDRITLHITAIAQKNHLVQIERSIWVLKDIGERFWGDGLGNDRTVIPIISHGCHLVVPTFFDCPYMSPTAKRTYIMSWG